MWYQDLLTTAITVCGEVQGHNYISEKEIVLEFLLLELRSIKAMGYSRKPRPILRFLPEAIQSRLVLQLLLSCQHRLLH